MKHCARGVTMVETVLSTIVVSVLLSGALSAAVSSRGTRVVAEQRAFAVDLADDLLCEILQQAFVDPQTPGAAPGPDTGETTRADYDDIDDYSGWQASPPTSIDGTAIAGAEGLTRMVTLLDGKAAGFVPSGGVWETFTAVRVEVYRGSVLLCRLEGARTDARSGVGR
ncbi:MAG: hypothetical protein DYG94_04790 [Leptolyngbya sp. PLA3]|nr:MAG: hypothetical protein EDM82_03940 [Cyanobacteria bacterium CYA]MCE7968049.1 hypothetical protein [Leptolyngbya sp. PL-A3]